MKRLFTIVIAVLFTASAFAQAPQKMSYQAIIRNSNNSLVANIQIGMRISILQNVTPVYVETQTATTNANGLVTFEIGNGTIVSGTFASINWAVGPYFIKTETDPGGGTNYSIVGSSELLSVPFALFAANGGTGAQGQIGLPGIDGTTGPQGPQGPIGLTGPAGINGTNGINGGAGLQGAQGVPGIQGADAVSGITYKGDYNETETYAEKDVVRSLITGSSYYCKVSTSNNKEPSANPNEWSLFVMLGATGLQGIQGIQGLTGPAGTNGTNGVQGIQGITGPTGATGIQGVPGASAVSGINYKGDYSTTVTYVVKDVVRSPITGNAYYCKVASSIGNEPSTNPSDWEMFVIAGAQGVQGAQGLQGTQGLTGDQGLQGTQGIQGTQGLKGDQGLQGIQGLQGTEGLQGLTGDQGLQGLTGDSGVAFDDAQILTTKTWTSNKINDELGLKVNTSILPTLPISGFANPVSNVAMGDGTTNYKLTNLADPTVNQDAATKKYVDDSRTNDVAGNFYQGTAADIAVFNGLSWADITSATNLGTSIPNPICDLNAGSYIWIAFPKAWGAQNFFYRYGTPAEVYAVLDGFEKRLIPAATTGSIDYQVWVFKSRTNVSVNLIINN